MDSQTPESLFQEVADVKKYNSRLEVWISVGGWTFSDNGTATQPLFGDIARSAGKRRAWANNVLKFLNQYGYDGTRYGSMRALLIKPANRHARY
jgi:chitinase